LQKGKAMGARAVEKKILSAKGLLDVVKRCFNRILPNKTDRRGRKSEISLSDCLMSALAMFGLKFPSLLQFDQQKDEEIIKHNLRNLYQVECAPSDSYMRDRLDQIDPKELRDSFSEVFSALQRGKVLESYVYLDGCYLLLVDGTGSYSSHCIGCESCCQKHSKDGTVTYYHQMLAGVIAHPDHKEVFPLCPEPISKRDGTEKNDCERNSAFRFFDDFRREHPHLKVITVSDALSSNGPYILKLQSLGMRYILGVKPGGNKSLFEYLNGIDLEKAVFEKDGAKYTVRWINGIPLNDTHPDILVNFFECTIIEKNGDIKKFSWITDLVITKQNVFSLIRAGRARWKVENETFNTLKNQGYQYERNFGHGKQHLCHVFALLMFLAFLIDQVQQSACGLFQAALAKTKSKTSLWFTMKALFTGYYILNWQDLYESIAYGFKGGILTPDTS
jgi:hypothetical protein